MTWKKTKRLFVAFAFAGIPLITTVSCDPYGGTFAFYRDDDYDDYHDDFFDWFSYDDDYYYDDYYYDDCCYDDYYYDEIVFFP